MNAQPQPQKPQNTLFVLVVNGIEINTVMAGLAELPAKHSEALRANITQQAQNQTSVLSEVQRLAVQQQEADKSTPDAVATVEATPEPQPPSAPVTEKVTTLKTRRRGN